MQNSHYPPYEFIQKFDATRRLLKGGVQGAGRELGKPGFLTRTGSRRTPNAKGSYFDSLDAGISNSFAILKTLSLKSVVNMFASYICK